MVHKQLIALAAFATLAFAGTAARADDITMADESFMSSRTRAEVRAEVLKARADGVTFASEIDLAPTMTPKKGSAVSREQVRAEVGDAARKVVMQWYPA
ncbi:MAG: DUF4148 domain-containing protein [Rubrivivax sp.]|nr:DUF4148 domain-containing protein [Rubrivivax sp.]